MIFPPALRSWGGSAFGPGIGLIADPATQDITFRPSGASPQEFFRLEMTLAP